MIIRLTILVCLLLATLLSTADSPAVAAPPVHGDWIVTGTEVVEDDTITLDGNLIIEGGGSLTLINATLEINVQDDEQYGISVEPEGSLFVYDSNILSTSEYGFTFQAGKGFRYDYDRPEPVKLVIRNSELRGVTGLNLSVADHTVIEDSTILVNIQNVDKSFITLSGSHHTTLRNNRISAHPPLSTPLDLPAVGGIGLTRSHNNTVTGNYITDTQNGIHLVYSWNNYIADNTWTGPIGVSDLKELTPLWWSVTTTKSGHAGVYIGPWSNNNVIENNNLFLSSSATIVIQRSSNNRITGNTVKGAGLGIALLWTSNNIIDNNEFVDIFKEDAVHAYRARDNFIINNRISSSAAGIGLFTSNNNTVHGNTISDSGRGIFLHDSNTVHSNNFVRNRYQGYDDGDNNDWENNHWGKAVAVPHAIPPQGVEGQPSDVHIPVSLVEAPELEPLPFKEVVYRDS